MSNDHSSHADGDFTNVPPSLPPRAADVRLTPEISRRKHPGQPLVPGARVKLRNKKGIFDWLLRSLLGAMIPIVLAGVSWLLGGNLVWAVLAVLGAAALVIVLFAGLRGKQLGDFRLRHFLVFGYLVLCVGVWTAVGYFLPLTPVQVEASNLEQEPQCPLRIIYGGQVRLEVDRSQRSTFEVRGPFQPAELKIQMLTTQGWVDRSFKSDANHVSLAETPTTVLYVDNRNNKEVQLVCGQLSFRVEARGKERFRILKLSEDTRCPIMIDDREVGSIGAKSVLVDTLGTRSYRWQTHTYGDDVAKLQHGGLLGDLLSDDSQDFVREHVHELPGQIDFFFEPAPYRIQRRKFVGSGERETRTELNPLEP